MESQESFKEPLLLNESIKGSVSISPAFSAGILSTKNSSNQDYITNDTKENSQKKKRCGLKALQVSSGICIVIALLVALALPPALQMLILDQATQQMIMTEQNQGRWAHFPGDTQTQILRNFTFYKLENQAEFLFQNKKPLFREFSGYKIQQLQDFIDIQYLQNGNKVKVRDWLRFGEWSQSRSLDEKVSILNMGALGYWSTLKSARPTLLLQQGLALLFTNLEDSIIPTLIGSGINQQFLPNSSALYSSLLSPAGIQKNNGNFMWSDPAYGFSNKENVGFWAKAATNCFENSQNMFVISNQANILKNYFVLTDGQAKILMQKIYNYVKMLRKLLLQNHYCAQINMEDCTGRYLAVAQIADGWTTSHTPPVSTISPNDTICDDNVTCKGKYPELYAYAKNVFKISQKLAKELNIDQSVDIAFPRQAVLKWFDYNRSIQAGIGYNTAQNCLLHIGNLDALWEMGLLFQKSLDTSLLQPIRARFGLATHAQTLIFWRWLQYFVNEFVLQQNGNAYLGMANLFTSGLYEQFTYLQDNLQRFLLGKMLQKEISTLQCQQFFEDSLQQWENPNLIEAICNYYNFSSNDFGMSMIDICEMKFGTEWQNLRNIGVSLWQMENFCDLNGNGVGKYIHEFKVKLNELYGCNYTPNPYCSNFQLALLQWHNSTATLNPPEGLSLSSTTTFSSWKKEAKAIEYEHFINNYFSNDRQKFPRYSLQELYSLFTFQELFSTNSLTSKLGQQSLNPYFLKYFRYVCIYITLNGFSTTQHVGGFLFGYQDEFLKQIKNAYPPFGGDPSTRSQIAFNDLNITKEEARQTVVFRTGKDDFRSLYQHYEINGHRYLVNNYSRFDGNKTIWEWKSPWAEEDYFYGTTAKIFPPNQFQANNLSMLVPNIQRYGSIRFHNQTRKTQKYGTDVYVGKLTSTLGVVSDENAKYYQTIPNIFNVSSIYGMPLYISKNHFYNSSMWLEKVDIINEDGTIYYKENSAWDDSFVVVQPYTGASFQSCVYLQNNYYHQKDPLFNYPTDTMLPVFSVYRSGNLTQEKFHQLYGDLIMALAVKGSLVYVGIGLGVISLAIFVIVTIKKRKNRNEDSTDSFQRGEFDLNKSLQTVEGDNLPINDVEAQ